MGATMLGLVMGMRIAPIPDWREDGSVLETGWTVRSSTLGCWPWLCGGIELGRTTFDMPHSVAGIIVAAVAVVLGALLSPGF
jgi:hypothetical protein